MLVIHLMVGKVKVRARIIGKIATVLQMAVVLWIMLKWEESWLRALTLGTAICTGISGLLYVWDGSRQLSAHPSSSPGPSAGSPESEV
jgi:phosphatidylglycerophosphate synthase